MARVGGINIPDNKHIDVSLTHIYGIGRKTAQNICDKLSIKYTKKVSELSEDQLDKIRDELNNNANYLNFDKKALSLDNSNEVELKEETSKGGLFQFLQANILSDTSS